MLVDVGSSTLDIVAFNLVGRERVAVFSAAVELLGAAALDSALSRQLSAGDFKRACDHEFEEVFGRARSPERAQDGFHAAYRSEEHTSELQSLMRISYAVFCLKKKNTTKYKTINQNRNKN